MNIFRLVADMLHLASIIILLLKIHKTRSCAGISLKTQALYAIVFSTRYLDLFSVWISLYNEAMKIFFIASSCYIVWQILFQFRSTYDPMLDKFPVEYLGGGAFCLALIFHVSFNLMEILWSFSIFLESVAILPQLYILQTAGEAEIITTHYVAALGGYRALYILNWLYRYYTENKVDWISVTAGIVQTLIYSDFFYIYYTRVLKGKKFALPQGTV